MLVHHLLRHGRLERHDLLRETLRRASDFVLSQLERGWRLLGRIKSGQVQITFGRLLLCLVVEHVALAARSLVLVV